MKYSDLNLSINNEIVTTTVNEVEIEVRRYLPIEDKIDLIEKKKKKAEENGIYNEMKLAMYFDLYIIYMYTNLEFTDEEKMNEYKLYNELESNGVITAVLGALEEYEILFHYLNIMKEAKIRYKTSAAAMIQTFIQDMPKNAEAMSEIVDNFDKEKYKEVVDFAQYANGGRPL